MDRYPDEKIIADVRKLYESLGRAPKRREYLHAGMAIKRFGSWTKTLNRADIEAVDIRKKLSKEELIALLVIKTNELGYTPRVFGNEFPHTVQAVGKFGSWNAFIRASGLIPREPGESVTDSKKRKRHTLESLMDVALSLEKELGRFPTYQEYPYLLSVMQRFGTWNKFKEACAHRKNKPTID